MATADPIPAGFGACPVPKSRYDQVLLGHGSGGLLTADLIQRVFVPGFGGDVLARLEDQATLERGTEDTPATDDPSRTGLHSAFRVPRSAFRVAFTTDSFVVRPLFFPGGDIGTLAVHGTVNDLAVGGARPSFLSAAFILEEGLPLADLERIVASMRAACREAGVALVTGDTKVVDRGKGDGVFVTTSGIGVVPDGRSLSIHAARPGDRVLVSGALGDHGIAILSVREGLEFETVLESDTAPLNGLTEAILAESNGVPYGRKTQREPAVKEIHVLWSPDGLGCDGDTISTTAATQPSIEDIVMGAIPGLPKVHLHNRVLAYSLGGEEYLEVWRRAAEGRLDAPFVLVIEGSIPNEEIKSEGYWAAMGNDPRTGQPITLNTWIDRLAPKAFAVVAAGTCAAYGGIHAMAGNPTGCMGLADYLGWDFHTRTGLPVVNVPGCPVQPDNMTETLLHLLYQAAGLAPVIPLDDKLRPTWQFGKTVHEGCDRAGYYEQADFANEYGSSKCLVKIGCWGLVVNCNVTKRGWMAGIGGCPNVGGICIACTMPGFPDKFMPLMDEPPGGVLSSGLISVYGRVIRGLRSITNTTVNEEPKWRHRGRQLTTGYHPSTYGPQPVPAR